MVHRTPEFRFVTLYSGHLLRKYLLEKSEVAAPKVFTVITNLKKKLNFVCKLRFCSLVSLGFFDDILIPPSALQHPSRFDEREQAWVWAYDTGDGNKHDLFMDAGESIRFKVTAETFNETCPKGPLTVAGTSESTENKIPYSLTVSTK